MSWLKRSFSELVTAGLVAEEVIERGGLAVLPGFKEGLYGITLLIGVVVSEDIILRID